MPTIKRQILISAPKESVRQYLRDLERMSDYAPKVRTVSVSYPDAQSGLVEAEGRFMALPWTGSFRVDFTADGGYRREMLRGPLPRLVGGVHLRSVAGGTVLTHEQHFQLPLPLRPLAFMWRRWLLGSMERELHVIKEGAEALNRKLQLQTLESPL